MNLLDETMELARVSRLPVSAICEAIGVTPRWHHKLMSGKIKDPSVRRIQRLYDFLNKEYTLTNTESSYPKPLRTDEKE
ncbi:hypothetical protein CCP3SC15_1210005 [Gammaproteobacteria bacterium]